MSRFFVKLPGLLAAAALVLPMPICPCSERSHSHDCRETSLDCEQYLTRDQHHGKGNCHGSHQPTPEGRHCPCPESCGCGPQNSQATVPPKAATTDPPDRESLTWLDQTSALSGAVPGTPGGLGRHATSAGSALHAGSLSQGNPCALLCCWLF